VIVPINPKLFGDRALPPNCHQTDFLFLRHRQPALAPRMQKFVDDAAAIGAPLVLLAFNSLPLPRLQVLRIAVNLIKNCREARPRVVALCSASGKDETGAKKDFMMLVDKFKAQGKLFEAPGATYPHLLKKVSVLVCNGGVGTTSEGLLAGLPIIVTGMQIMDQPFWGRRIYELGCGPEPVHINKFNEVCVNLVEQATRANSPWQQRARAIADDLAQNGGAKAGNNATVNLIVQLMDKVKPVRDESGGRRGSISSADAKPLPGVPTPSTPPPSVPTSSAADASANAS